MKWMGDNRRGQDIMGKGMTGQERTKLGEGMVTIGRTVHDKMT